MSSINASASGQFRIGDITVNRLGYGAMRITDPGIRGEPSDRPAALATLRRLPEIGVNFIDTADSYVGETSWRPAPVTILIDERADGVNMSYDLMASFLAPYGNAQASVVAAQLDEKIVALLTAAAE